LGAFSPAAGAPAAGENRAFRGCALSRSGRGASAASASHPYNRIARLNAQSALSFLSLRFAQTPDMVVKQFFFNIS
jgi:hypothetical protein